MDCEYSRYGCAMKMANEEHMHLHLVHHASSHLRMVLVLLEKEAEKNKSLVARIEQLERRESEREDQHKEKLKEVDVKIASFKAFLEARLTDSTQVPTPRHHHDTPDPLSPSPRHENGLHTKEDIKETIKENIKENGKEIINNDIQKKENHKDGYHPSPPSPIISVEALKDDNRKPSILQRRAETPASAGVESLPPFIVKSSSLDTESSARPHTPMSLREDVSSPSARVKGKTWSNAARDKEVKPSQIVVSQDSPEVDEEYEQGIIWEYDPISDKWSRGLISFKLTKKAFAEGALRAAHSVQIYNDIQPVTEPPEPSVLAGKEFKDTLPEGLTKLGNKFVAKISKTRVPVERYFDDVKMQMLCSELCKKFNMYNVPKRVDFLHAWVLEIPRKPTIWCGLEAFIEGEFKKHNTNTNLVLTVRNTPQAFSHFTWENSKHTKIVVDLQGVNDFYTDPQIHTVDGKGFGLGNLGRQGIDGFLRTHQCNAICNLLTLPRINALDTKEAKKKLIVGTQQVPYIEDQLQPLEVPRLEAPDNVSSGGEFQCTSTLTGHTDRVASLCATPKYLFSGCGDGSVRVWNLPSMTLEKELNVHRKSVETLCANEKYLFTGSADHSVKVWEIGSNFNLVIALRDHVGEVNALCLTDKNLNYLISASFDKNIKVWSLRNFRCMQTLSGHSKSVKSLAVSGSILFSGSNDGSIYVWNLKAMSCVFTIDAHQGWVKSLAIKDNYLYSGSYDYHIKKWDLTTFNCLSTMSFHNDSVNSICLTDQYLLSASEEKTVSIIDLATEKVVGTLKGHRSGVQDVVTDSKVIYSASDDGTIKAWKWCSA